MSYEHCDEHDEDATNGCAKCDKAEVDAQRAVIDEVIRKHAPDANLNRFAAELETEFMRLAQTRLGHRRSVWP